jgi:hypothetical protein
VPRLLQCNELAGKVNADQSIERASSRRRKSKVSLTAFLSYYERAHQNRANRYVHHLAHATALAGILLLWRPLLGLALIASGFLISWMGHYAFERNTPAFFEAAPVRGLRASVARKLQVALGGLVWSAACFLRLFGVGPLAQR